MEIKIVKRDMLGKGVAFALYVDNKEHTVATIGELLNNNYQGICVLLANTTYSLLENADPRSPTLRAAVRSEQNETARELTKEDLQKIKDAVEEEKHNLSRSKRSGGG